MTLHLDHVFICTSVEAPEAEALLDAGLVEGSSNIHPGQGTANRKFFFENAFLELLWVRDEREARSALTTPTRLWERWTERGGNANPFGICLSSSQGAASLLPFSSWTYRPRYLPEERYILFADGAPLSEPELFALSWPRHRSSPPTEPTSHRVGLFAFRSVSIGLTDPNSISGVLSAARDSGCIRIHGSAAPELVIEFTSQQDVQLSLPSLGLRLIGRPE